MNFAPKYFLLKQRNSWLPRLINIQSLAAVYGDTPSHISSSRNVFEENLKDIIRPGNLGPQYECLIVKHVKMLFLSQRHVESQPDVDYCIPLTIVGAEYLAIRRKETFRLPSSHRYLVRTIGVACLAANLACSLASLVHFWGTLLFDTLTSLIRSSTANILKDSTIWIGHGETAPRDVDSLSELQMLRELYTGATSPLISNAPSVNRIKREAEFVLLPRLARMVDLRALEASSLFSLLGTSLTGILRGRDFRILHELLTTDLIVAILSRNTPKCVLSSTSILQGDPTMHAAAHLKIRSIMLHYGTNTLLPKFVGDTVDAREHLSAGRAPVSEHVVWDELHAEWFREQYMKAGRALPTFHVSGPLMFCSINFNFSYRSDRFTVGVFDVVPPSLVHLLQIGYGATAYSMSAIEEFWNEVTECLSGLNLGSRDLRVVVKPKRDFKAEVHDTRYQEYLRVLEASAIGRSIEFREPSENPWKTIACCDAVIGVPYTSMVQASDYLGIPACFFYPKNRVAKSPFKATAFAGNRIELKQFLESALKSQDIERRTFSERRRLEEVHARVRSVILGTKR